MYENRFPPFLPILPPPPPSHSCPPPSSASDTYERYENFAFFCFEYDRGQVGVWGWGEGRQGAVTACGRIAEAVTNNMDKKKNTSSFGDVSILWSLRLERFNLSSARTETRHGRPVGRQTSTRSRLWWGGGGVRQRDFDHVFYAEPPPSRRVGRKKKFFF